MHNVPLRVPIDRLRLVGALAIVAGLSVGAHGAVPLDGASDELGRAGEAAARDHGARAPVAAGLAPAGPAGDGERYALHRRAWSDDRLGALNRSVLELALGAARCAMQAGQVQDPATLTIIDYSKPSTEPRLWVLDLRERVVLYEELVSHGQGSGGNLATAFSNTPNSHQTSLGLFVTDEAYVGRNGYSLRLTGLERGINDRARERAIVMHGAPYVNAEIVKSLGRLGRSHGCPAVREPIARDLIDRVKGGGLLFAYYPDPEWLGSSAFLNACPSRAADE